MSLDRRRLARCLGLLGSDHDGEVLAAARRAYALLRSSGMTWEDVVVKAEGDAPPAESETLVELRRAARNAEAAASTWRTMALEEAQQHTESKEELARLRKELEDARNRLQTMTQAQERQQEESARLRLEIEALRQGNEAPEHPIEDFRRALRAALEDKAPDPPKRGRWW